MKKAFSFFCLLLFSFTHSFAQKSFQRNSFYLEALGSGLFGSLNYERQLTGKPGIGLRFGAGFYTENAFYLTIPVGVNYLFPLKKQSRFVDVAFNVSPTFRDGDFKSTGENKWVNFIPSAGYRTHTKQNWMWRVALTPVINRFAVIPSAGISVGKVF